MTDFVTDAPLLTTINYYAVTGPLSELVRDTFGFTLYGDGTMVNFSGFDNDAVAAAELRPGRGMGL